MKTFAQKILYLDRLLHCYVKLLKAYNEVEVLALKDIVITFKNTKKTFYAFDRKEVPMEDLDRIILSYKGKFNTLWKKRLKTK